MTNVKQCVRVIGLLRSIFKRPSFTIAGVQTDTDVKRLTTQKFEFSA